MKPYDSLKVKNASMKSVHYVTEYAVSSLVSSLILFKAGPTQPSAERFRRFLLGIKAEGGLNLSLIFGIIQLPIFATVIL
jgi:hypothetical protein